MQNIANLDGFTIHFATINTSTVLNLFLLSLLFTIHFATINTEEFVDFYREDVEIYNTLCYY